jgi:hypothetical protein
MPGDSKPISDAALSRLTAYVEIECEGSDDEFIEGNDVRVNFADLKGLLARLRSVEMERDRYEAWNEDAERKIAFEERLADVPYKVIREKLAELAAAQAKLSEVERERDDYKAKWFFSENCYEIVLGVGRSFRSTLESITGMCGAPDAAEACRQILRVAQEALSPSGGKDSSGEDRGEGGEG